MRDLLVVDDGRGADELVDLRVALPSQLRYIPFSGRDDLFQAGSHAPAHVPDGLKPSHLVADGRFACEQVRLVRAEALRVERHRLRQRRKLRADLGVHLVVQPQELGVGRARRRYRRCRRRRTCGKVIFGIEQVWRWY